MSEESWKKFKDEAIQVIYRGYDIDNRSKVSWDLVREIAKALEEAKKEGREKAAEEMLEKSKLGIILQQKEIFNAGIKKAQEKLKEFGWHSDSCYVNQKKHVFHLVELLEAEIKGES